MIQEDPLPEHPPLDFTNTAIAFSNKSDAELKETFRLFSLMNNPKLVEWSSKLGLWAVKLKIPFSEFLIKKTIFKQFCGGETILDCQRTIDKLYRFNTLTILDYGAEGKSTEEEFDAVMQENIRAIEMAASNNSVPVISIKVSGLIPYAILEKLQTKAPLSTGEQRTYQRMLERIEQICEAAYTHGVGVFIDAEESWIQIPIDDLALKLMEEYNSEKVIIYNTYQMYRHDKLAQIKKDHQRLRSKGALFGAKIVRGAYMEKERQRATDMGYASPIQPDKAATDRDFDEAMQYCFNHYEEIGFCCASHNMNSNMLLAGLIEKAGVEKNHAHLNFCQLYGMSDYISFNLSAAGFNVAKYVPYGPVSEVVPYLIRRAQENSSITGEMSRELSFIQKEMVRRSLR